MFLWKGLQICNIILLGLMDYFIFHRGYVRKAWRVSMGISVSRGRSGLLKGEIYLS